MALSNAKVLYGIHSATFYNRTNGLPYGMLRVLKNSSLSLSGEQIKLTGGSSKYPWSVQDGLIESSVSLAANEYPPFLFEVLLGKAPTETAADTDGYASTLTDKYGTVVNATTGIASVGVKADSETDLKFGTYIVKVVSGTTVDVYCTTNLDFTRGTDLTFDDDDLKITASALTIPDSGAKVTIPSCGLELTGGSGTVNLETAGAVGDTAIFMVRPIHAGIATEVVVGGSTDTYPEFGMMLAGQQLGSGEMVLIDCFKCKAIGLPINFNANEFSEWESTIELSYDSAQNGVFKLYTVNPSA